MQPTPVPTEPLVEQTLMPVGGFLDRSGIKFTVENTEWWAWAGLGVAVFMGLALGKIASIALKRVSKGLADRKSDVAAVVVRSLAGPVNLGLITAGFAVGLSFVALSSELRDFTLRVVQLLYIITVGWLLYNLVDLVTLLVVRLTRDRDAQLQAQLVPLMRRSLRILLIVILVLFTAENVFQQDVKAFIAGLGIAGLAVSLAAQDSIRNLFGSVTIFADQPFSVGDRIQVDGQDGIVEEIGFRSTRMRALTGQIVTIPNARVSDSTVQNFSKRVNIRRIMDVSVTYDTPPEKMIEAIGILRGILAEPEIAAKLDPANPPRVHFDEYGPDFLRIRVWYWFTPVEWWQYCEHAEKINLLLLQRFNAAGIDFAFPSRTLYLAGDSKRKLDIGVARLDA